MKYLMTIVVVLTTFVLPKNGFTQNVNWGWVDQANPHYGHLSFGYDFGITAQAGYGYLLNFKKPILFSADVSLPMGQSLLDDFKTRMGGQMALFSHENFMASVKVFGHLKKHETKLVRLTNLGAEVSVLAGYYHAKWHIAGEFGFDKPLLSHVKHGEAMKTNFPAIRDGWYNSLGGYLYYGIQAGKSISDQIDLSVRVGSTNALNNHNDAIIPRYAQLGFMYQF